MSYAQDINEDILSEDDDVVGSVYGVIHFDWKHLENWLYKKDVSETAIDRLHKLSQEGDFFPIALLDNINVEEEYRGQGYGTQGMQLFHEHAQNEYAETSLLIADIHEKQSVGFQLKKWYKLWGYTPFGKTTENNLVMFKRF